MQEIGGYIELDTNYGIEYHSKAIPLNCGRNCLAYLIQAKKISKIFLPFYICDSITEICTKYKVPFEYYSIDNHFRPILDYKLPENSFLFIVNYYGQLSEFELNNYVRRYDNVIIDNSQAFFEMPTDGADVLYSCRKFFGVTDGAYLFTDSRIESEFEIDMSYQRMNFILGRFENNANEFYNEYIVNNKVFRNQPIKQMSKLTHNLLRGIDYNSVRQKRTQNYCFLHSRLKGINQLNLTVPEGAFMYPLYIDNGFVIRKELQKNKIYVPMLWPGVLNVCAPNMLEYKLARNLLPLPCDQRYSEIEMNIIVEEIMTCIN